MKLRVLDVEAHDQKAEKRPYRRRRVAFSLCVGMLSPFFVVTNPTVGAQGADQCAAEGQACIEIEKAGVFIDENGDGFAQAGETIFYSFTVKNTGSVTLTDVVVTDELERLTLDGTSILALEPGSLDATSFAGAYEISNADISTGNVSNRASVVAVTPDGSQIADLSDDPANDANTDPEGDGEPDDVTRVTLRAPNPTLNPDAVLDNPVGSIVTVDVLANDTSFAVDPSSVMVVDPSTGAVDSVLAVDGEGDWLASSVTGAITFFPEPGLAGDPTPITYQASDSSGVVADPVEVVVTYVAAGEAEAEPEEVEAEEAEPEEAEAEEAVPEEAEPEEAEAEEAEPEEAAPEEDEAEAEAEEAESEEAEAEEAVPEEAEPEEAEAEEAETEEAETEEAEAETEEAEAEAEEEIEPIEIDDIEELDQPAGSAVDLDVVAADEDVVPATVELVDPETGEAAGDELVIPGEGVATVDKDTGVITFTPDPELVGNPSPLEFVATTVLGEVVTATATVTFEEPVEEAPAVVSRTPETNAQSATDTTTTTTTTTTAAPTTAAPATTAAVPAAVANARPSELAFTGVKEDLTRSAILALASGMVAYILSALATPVARKED